MTSSQKESYVSHETRLTRYAIVSTAVTLLSDEQLRERVEDATGLDTGIGGATALMQIEETPIFVKIIPLTEKERLTENAMSTKNVFKLPPYCQYGIGSPGFSVWRGCSPYHDHQLGAGKSLCEFSVNVPLAGVKKSRTTNSNL